MPLSPSETVANLGYLLSILLFAFGIQGLSALRSARRGNTLAALAMLVAIVCRLIELEQIDITGILLGVLVGASIGAVMAIRVEMTAMPQMVAIFNGLGGAASALVALSLYLGARAASSGALVTMNFQGAEGLSSAVALYLSLAIGAVTLTGSVVAYLKLSSLFGKTFSAPRQLLGGQLGNLLLMLLTIACGIYWVGFAPSAELGDRAAWASCALALVLGITLVMPIGGADMPVVVSLLNSYSGLAVAATGFALHAKILIVSGSLVGASGIILTMIMCRGMNRSLLNVMMGGVGGENGNGKGGGGEYHNVKSADPEEAALDLVDARSVIIVPGYGLAVAQGQNAVGELASQLKERGCQVRYAIHPVAGRMPGHMNVLLAESNTPYEDLYEMDLINKDFKQTDVALVVGANDVVNPSAKEDKSSPLYGMPVLNVDQARTVFVIKRSLSPGYSGVKNELFERANCRMIYGDAKHVLEQLTTHLDD